METREMYDTMNELGLLALRDFQIRGQQNYGDAFLDLGAKGQFSEIWRKVKKLQRSVWEDGELIGETPGQVAGEIIPHLLMLIYCLTAQESPSEQPTDGQPTAGQEPVEGKRPLRQIRVVPSWDRSEGDADIALITVPVRIDISDNETIHLVRKFDRMVREAGLSV